MTTPTTRMAYEDCFELYDKAIETARGIRFKMSDKGAAKNFRLRLHAARAIDRNDNLGRDKNDPLYGRSVYDPIVCRLEEAGDEVWLRLEKRSIDQMHIEEIEDEQQGPTDSNRGEAQREEPNQSGEGEAKASREEPIEDEIGPEASVENQRVEPRRLRRI